MDAREVARRQAKITEWLREALPAGKVIGPEERSGRRGLPDSEAGCYVWWIIVGQKHRLLIPEAVLGHGSDQSEDVRVALIRQGFLERLRECKRWVVGKELELRCGGPVSYPERT
jgi:hypothetical protein